MAADSSDSPSAAPATGRTKVRRLPERGVYDATMINAILDEALICHVGFAGEDGPIVIPTIHARAGETLYLHGSPASAMLRRMKKGEQVSVAVTIVDALVIARSVFHHSMNYRSVVVFGTPREVVDRDEKLVAFQAITEHVAQGRWADARQPSEKELRSTLVVAIGLDEASAKIRTGPPADDDEDMGLPIWAGLVPVDIEWGRPIADPLLIEGQEVPPYLSDYSRQPGETGPE